ncbi:hypothetical protein LUZ61_015792 [Rhynchospora tenuis]|uniref:ENT domain-containing protein n=1 Tax=Rhynchospora tenuis TaxID=198213 RepID=A0AAD6EJ95_9POAL|nr:hypothetical protein LUZ61_015792 [Rhynchospora tenuis]
MRFKKGSKVEVFHSSKVLPAGCWKPAVIARGNGRTYFVQYNHCCSSSPNNNTDEERVPRKVLRPPPPVKEKAVKWAPDDLVEVFVHGFWKLAKVTGVAYGNEYYFVSLFCQCREVAVKKSNLRKRCAWENGKWITIKKETGMEMWNKKRKLLEVAADKISKKVQVSEKVYANNSCENGSAVSSTGSCSTSGSIYQHPVSGYCEDDAVSSFVPVKVAGVTSFKSTGTEAHKLELDAYHSTMVALYANGSISWEQEAILSNLRLLLNISFDEHQSVLRSLTPSR